MLETSMRIEWMGGLFHAENERVKTLDLDLLSDEFGRTREIAIVNAYIQNTINFPVISGSQPAKVHEFCKTLFETLDN